MFVRVNCCQARKCKSIAILFFWPVMFKTEFLKMAFMFQHSLRLRARLFGVLFIACFCLFQMFTLQQVHEGFSVSSAHGLKVKRMLGVPSITSSGSVDVEDTRDREAFYRGERPPRSYCGGDRNWDELVGSSDAGEDGEIMMQDLSDSEEVHQNGETDPTRAPSPFGGLTLSGSHSPDWQRPARSPPRYRPDGTLVPPYPYDDLYDFNADLSRSGKLKQKIVKFLKEEVHDVNPYILPVAAALVPQITLRLFFFHWRGVALVNCFLAAMYAVYVLIVVNDPSVRHIVDLSRPPNPRHTILSSVYKFRERSMMSWREQELARRLEVWLVSGM